MECFGVTNKLTKILSNERLRTMLVRTWPGGFANDLKK